MSQPLEILGGAFTAELVKGQWKYTHNPNAKKKVADKEAPVLKEKPEYPIIVQYERSALLKFQGTLRDTTLEITRLLKSFAKV